MATSFKQQTGILWPEQSLNDIAKLWPHDAESLESLYGDTDQNLRVVYPDGSSRVLKITASGSTRAAAVIRLQVAALQHIQGHTAELSCPVPVPSRDGQYIHEVSDAQGGVHHAWMLNWLPGRVLDDVPHYDDGLLYSIGRSMALIDHALLDFHHPAAHRHIIWDLANILELRDRLEHIRDPHDRQLAGQAFAMLEYEMLPQLSGRSNNIIHNDGGNQHNMLLPSEPADNNRIVSVIDFGDIVYTNRLCELGIAAAYATFGCDDRVHAICTTASGYHEVMPLDEVDQRLLPMLVLARYLMSVCNAAERGSREPDNAYAQVSAESAWKGLRFMLSQEMRQVADAVSEHFGHA